MSTDLNPWYRLTILSYLQSAVSNAIEKLAEQREWSDRVKDSDTANYGRLAAEYRAASLEADAAYRRLLAEIDSMKERCGR